MKSTANSAPFTVERSALFWQVLATPAMAWPLWLIAGVSVCVLVAGIFTDIAVVIVGFLLLFTIVPAAASFLYLYRTTSPELLPNILPHTVEQCGDTLKVNIFRKNVEADSEGREKVSFEKVREINIRNEEVVRREAAIDYDILTIKGPQISLLLIPR